MAHIIFKTDPGAGLFSNFNRIISELHDDPNIKKITWALYGHTSGCMGYDISGELFSLIFNEYDTLQGSIPLYTKNSINWGDPRPNRITGTDASLYHGPNRYKLQPYNDIFNKYFKLNSNIESLIYDKRRELHNNHTDVIAIIVRNSGNNALASEQLKNRMPTRGEYIEEINRISKPGQWYFLCIDNDEDLEFFKSIYPNSYYTDIRRSSSKFDAEPHKKTRGTLRDFIDTFVEIYLCSSCHTLVHCITNMATTSLLINMNQISVPV
jgi:hypothetical protein